MPRQPAPPALVVIDMINRFDFAGGPALARAALPIVPVIESLRQRFEQQQAPVIHVNDNFGNWDQDLDALADACMQQGGTAAAIVARLRPQRGHLRLPKPSHSALRGSALQQLLRQLQIERVVLAGVASDACVLATALDARMSGLQAWVPSDAVAARTPALQQSALHILRHGLRLPTVASARERGLFPSRA